LAAGVAFTINLPVDPASKAVQLIVFAKDNVVVPAASYLLDLDIVCEDFNWLLSVSVE
jgi:hypothetical protein